MKAKEEELIKKYTTVREENIANLLAIASSVSLEALIKAAYNIGFEDAIDFKIESEDFKENYSAN